MTSQASKLSITSEPEQVGRMRTWLARELLAEDLPAPDCAALVFAVGELCNNAILHAYGGAPGQPIYVSVRRAGDGVIIEVEYFGIPFDEARYTVPDLDATPERGLGIHLVRTIADSARMTVSAERGTCWTLVKRRPGPVPAPVPAKDAR